MANELPNILWICTDQQRVDTIHALGNPHPGPPRNDANPGSEERPFATLTRPRRRDDALGQAGSPLIAPPGPPSPNLDKPESKCSGSTIFCGWPLQLEGEGDAFACFG